MAGVTAGSEATNQDDPLAFPCHRCTACICQQGTVDADLMWRKDDNRDCAVA